MPILGLHGIAQDKVSPDILRKLWADSLDQGFDSAGVTPPAYHLAIPYYGKVLAGMALPTPVVGRAAASSQENFRSGESATAIEDEVAAELALRLNGRGGPDDNYRSVKGSMLQLICKYLSSENEARIIDAVLDQVACYLGRAEVRSAILSVSLEALEECVQRRTDEDPTLVVIAHSLGSVVAVDLLSRWKGPPVDLLVTVGSPLSIKGVFRRLAEQPPRWPGHVGNWINFADQDDVVALHGRIDRTNFFSESYARSRSCRCDVLNVLDVKNHMRNHHGIAGYLDDPVLASLLGRSMGLTGSAK